MKITELIEKLEGLKNTYGDLPVVLANTDDLAGFDLYDLEGEAVKFYAKTDKVRKDMNFPKNDTYFHKDIEHDEFTIEHESAIVLGY